MKTTDSNWNSFVEEPLVAEGPDTLVWDDTADVVVVGFGGAGATAAIQGMRVSPTGLRLRALFPVATITSLADRQVL